MAPSPSIHFDKLVASLEQTLCQRLRDEKFLLRLKQSPAFLKDVATMGASRGALMYANPAERLQLSLAPISIVPSAIGRVQFERAQSLSRPFARLTDQMACDPEFLRESLKHVCPVDSFTEHLMQIHEEVYCQSQSQTETGTGKAQPKRILSDDIRIYALRSDYMVDSVPSSESKGSGEGAEEQLLQVELNTIAASFGGLAQVMSGVHRLVLKRQLEELLREDADLAKQAEEVSASQPSEQKEGHTGDGRRGRQETETAVAEEVSRRLCPENRPAEGIARGLASAHRAYMRRYPPPVLDPSPSLPLPPLRVLFLVPHEERNECDQRLVEWALLEQEGVRCVRMSLDELVSAKESGALRLVVSSSSSSSSGGKETTTRRALVLENKGPTARPDEPEGQVVEISAVYFRSGYSPEQYKDQRFWNIRRLVEWSDAAKCPSVPAQLVGCKKIQQLWCVPSILSRFVSDEREREALRACFALQVDPGETLMRSEKEIGEIGEEEHKRQMEALQHAEREPGRYVLKPQREGGGNNLHGAAITAALQGDREALWQFILMQKIRPRTLPTLAFDRSAQMGTPPSAILMKGISELGIYSTSVCEGPASVWDSDASGALDFRLVGHLVRTKAEGVDEGGVATGFSVVDSPLVAPAH